MAPSPPRILRHAATLPPSVHLIHPKLHPCASILLIPPSIFSTLSLPKPPLFIHLDNRIATLHLTDQFLETSHPPPIPLLSPALAVLNPSLQISPLPSPSSPSLIAISAIFPTATASNARYFARLASRALQGRDAHSGDVLPLAAGVAAVVTRVEGEGVVMRDTKIEVRLGSVESVRMGEPLKMAARAKWGDAALWRVKHWVRQLDACVEGDVRVVRVTGGPDVDDVVRVWAVTEDITTIRGGNRREAVEGKMEKGGWILCERVDENTAQLVIRRLGDEEEHAKCGVIFVEKEGQSLQALRGRVEVEIAVDVADDEEREDILESFVDDESHRKQIVKMSTGYARKEIMRLGQVYIEGGLNACEKSAAFYGKGRLKVDTGNVSWKDIGGLEYAKEQILQLVDLSDSRTNMSNRRVGVLLYGPPGTGKTLLARAVASESGCSFISVKGPELLDMYVGESERHVREVFSKAGAASPCVVFFDELDALAPKRGRGSDSGGVAERVVSQLVGEFDEIRGKKVFVIGASNRPDLVDGGLLRPGRLDRMVYIGLPTSIAEMGGILQAVTRKFVFEGQIDWERVLENGPGVGRLSGADLYGLSVEAWMKAAKRHVNISKRGEEKKVGGGERIEQALHAAAEWVEKGEIYAGWFGGMSRKYDDNGDNGDSNSKEEARQNVAVTEEDFVEAAKELRPSLTLEQLREYEQLRIRIETGV